MNPPTLLIPQDQAQKLIDYLKQRPFVEVYDLINGLLRLSPAPTLPHLPQAKSEETK